MNIDDENPAQNGSPDLEQEEQDRIYNDPFANEEDFEGTAVANEGGYMTEENSGPSSQFRCNDPVGLKAQERKRKVTTERQHWWRAEKKAGKEQEEQETCNDKAPASKKRKIDATQDPEGEPVAKVVHITLFVEVVQAVQGSKNPLKPILKGPASFPSSDSYHCFLNHIARLLACPKAAIPVSKMAWRFMSPKNATSLLLTEEMDYEVMILETLRRKETLGYNVIITMPPFSKPAEDPPPWDTGEEDHLRFDFSSFKAGNTSSSLTTPQQRECSCCSKSSRKIPNSNHPFWPDKRVYTNKDNAHFDLDDMKIAVWASHITHKTANVDLENPPNSPYFDRKNQLIFKPSASAFSSASVTTATPLVSQPPLPSTTDNMRTIALLWMMQQQQWLLHQNQLATPLIAPPILLLGMMQQQQWLLHQDHPAMPLIAPPSVAAPLVPHPLLPSTIDNMLTTALLEIMQQQQLLLYQNYLAMSLAPSSVGLPSSFSLLYASSNLSNPTPSSAPPSPSTRVQVSLETFCKHYGLSDKDLQRLSALEYTPGNRAIEKVDRSEWESVGFKTLSWSSVLSTHRYFLADVKNGIWTS